MTCQAVEKVTSVTNGILGDELLPLLTNDVQTGGLCDMTSSRESYLSTGRLGDELLPLLTDDVETGGVCDM